MEFHPVDDFTAASERWLKDLAALVAAHLNEVNDDDFQV